MTLPKTVSLVSFFFAVGIILQLFVFKRFLVTIFRSLSRTPAISITALINVTKELHFRCCREVDLSLSLLGEVFQRYLSVSHTGQLVTQGKYVRAAKPVLCKIIAR